VIYQVVQESLGLVTMLEPQDEVIGLANDDDVAVGVPLPPLLHPQVEQVVQVHVREKWGDHPAHNVANSVLIETMIDRARLRPSRGSDWRPGGM
jgi:hypothetical protein